MAVFRVEKNSGYTVMSNHHLRNQELSLKAKGLLSQMLSLPDNWDYTLKGLSLINREKIDAIREAIRELERAGYIVRSRERKDLQKNIFCEWVDMTHLNAEQKTTQDAANPSSAAASCAFSFRRCQCLFIALLMISAIRISFSTRQLCLPIKLVSSFSIS